MAIIASEISGIWSITRSVVRHHSNWSSLEFDILENLTEKSVLLIVRFYRSGGDK